MRMSILLYDGFTALDVVGGYEVLSRLPGMETEFVARKEGLIAADTRRLGLQAYRALDEVKDTDILYVPGGPGGIPLERDEKFLAAVRRLDATSTWTFGVCNGVILLSAAGLLRGSTATTNWFSRHRLAAHGVQFVPERYDRAGKYVTTAGVSASLDGALFLASLIAGERVARLIQLGIEYFPSPPFAERSPAEVDPELQGVIEAFEKRGGAELLRLAPPFQAVGP